MSKAKTDKPEKFKSITIPLTKKQHAKLVKVSNNEHRSMVGHILYLLEKDIFKDEKKEGDKV